MKCKNEGCVPQSSMCRIKDFAGRQLRMVNALIRTDCKEIDSTDCHSFFLSFSFQH